MPFSLGIPVDSQVTTHAWAVARKSRRRNEKDASSITGDALECYTKDYFFRPCASSTSWYCSGLFMRR